MDDREICNLLLHNTEQGMYELIVKYNSYVKSITKRVLLDCHQDIEECIADTFISIWKNKESLNTNSGNIKGLLACIARNTAINRYRHIKKEQFLDIECENLVAEDEIESLIENIYQDEVINLMLNVLKEHHKEIFIRRHILMETIKEISEDMDIDERHIRNSLYQSKIKLQKSLVTGGHSNEKRIV